MPIILVIDDENTILENIKFVLELNDYEVLTASNGSDGLQIFNDRMNEIDLVLTDMKMPKLTGLEVLKEIKSKVPEMGVIILTGHGDMENAIKAMKNGAFEYLKKPINIDDLTIAVSNAIDKKNLLIENAEMHRKIIEQNNYLRGLNLSAQKILLNLLPSSLPDIEGYSTSVEYRSCEAVGGDMYNVFDVGDYICFYVFDVTSHGILASVISVILKSFIQNMEYNFTHGTNIKNFDEIVLDLNSELYKNTAQNVFATLFLGFIEKNTQKLFYVSAGHVTQFILNGPNLIPLSSTGTVLGVFEDASYTFNEVQLKYGDKVFLFTDGIVEASKDDIPLGYEGILNVFDNCRNQPVKDIISCLISTVTKYTDEVLSDDITILGLEVLE